MMQDLITVVIPVYNAENYIHRCVDSVLNQTYTMLEIILVNDGSKDKSGNICDQYAESDTRIKVIHKANGGVSSARNVGIRKATGRYLIFADSDDYLEDLYVEKMYKMQMKYKDACVICGFNLITEKGKYVGQNVYDTEKMYSEVSFKDIIDIINKWLINMPWNKLYDLEILKINNLSMIQDLSLSEDLLFNFDYMDKLESEKIIIINEPLYNYMIQRKGSLDNKYCSDQLEITRVVIDRLYGLCKNKKVKNMEGYYATAVLYMEGAMKNNMKKDNPQKYIKKIKENNVLMRSEEYQNYLKQSKQYFSWVRRIVCRLGNYVLFMMFSEAAECVIHFKEHRKNSGVS